MMNMLPTFYFAKPSSLVCNIHHLRISLLLSVLFFKNLKIFFQRMVPKASHLLEELSTKLILSQVQVYQIDQLIGQT